VVNSVRLQRDYNSVSYRLQKLELDITVEHFMFDVKIWLFTIDFIKSVRLYVLRSIIMYMTKLPKIKKN